MNSPINENCENNIDYEDYITKLDYYYNLCSIKLMDNVFNNMNNFSNNGFLEKITAVDVIDFFESHIDIEHIVNDEIDDEVNNDLDNEQNII
jgi:hypothetical protein